MSQDNLELQEKAEAVTAENGLIQSKAAKVMGVNEGFLILFRNSNSYKGNITDMESKLTKFFKLNEEKENQADSEFKDVIDGDFEVRPSVWTVVWVHGEPCSEGNSLRENDYLQKNNKYAQLINYHWLFSNNFSIISWIIYTFDSPLTKQGGIGR